MHLITFARMHLSFDQVRQDILATYSDRDVGTNSTPRVKSLCVLCMHQKGLCLLGCAGVYPCMCVCMYVFEGMYLHGIQGTPYILYGRLHCRPWRCWYLSSSINRWRHTQTPANHPRMAESLPSNTSSTGLSTLSDLSPQDRRGNY